MYGRIFHILLFILGVTFNSMAAPESSVPTSYPGYDEDVFMEWDLEKNIATPVVEKGEKKPIARYMKAFGEYLRDNHYTVELMREGEVLIVSIPSDELFLPNDTLLSDRADKRLQPLLQFMKQPFMYKILYTVNTDDTGSQAYLDNLSDARNASVYAWFMDRIDEGKLSEDLVIIPYSMGSTLPMASNDDREGRYKNRRLEIYFVPGPEMIYRAKHKELKKFTL